MRDTPPGRALTQRLAPSRSLGFAGGFIGQTHFDGRFEAELSCLALEITERPVNTAPIRRAAAQLGRSGMSTRASLLAPLGQDVGLTTAIALQVAALTSAVAILVAMVTQASAWPLERFRQTYERRRASLLEMQDHALEVRGHLAEIGNHAHTDPTAH